MIRKNAKTHIYRIETENTLYALRAVRGERVEHIYYGRKVRNAPISPYPHNYGFSPNDKDKPASLSHDIIPAELPGYGAGDFRAEAIRVTDKTGASATDFRFVSARIYKGKPLSASLPHARADETVETLELTLKDRFSGILAFLSFSAYPETDTVVRSVRYENRTKKSVRLSGVASLCADFPAGSRFDLINLPGTYYFERRIERAPLRQGNFVMTSHRGASGHQMNPYFALVSPEATENAGDCYAFNLIYSGAYTNTVELTPYRAVRVLSGLGDHGFSWLLGRGESFETPEATMCYSPRGIGEVRRKTHRFVKNYILKPRKEARAPIVLNTWEGTWFDVNEELILDYARAASQNGIEMLVMDDGWFGARVSDKAGLGDWFVNEKRFPEGLASTVRRVKEMGLAFGIWIEPEMVNPDSELYRKHPEYALAVPTADPSLSRDQLVLDMGNPEVVAYLKETLGKTLGGVGIDYFKWDFNRHLSDVYSSVLPPERQAEAAHRFMLGTYELLAWLREHFPDAMLETCSGGGGRYDLGMMYYGEQIWTSDNTDPAWRVDIQCASLLGYPAPTMSCHVANRENICEGKPRALRFRYAVAAAGPLGYEFNLAQCSDELCAAVREQIEEYKSYAHLPERGDYYELYSPYASPTYAYYYALGDEILLTALQTKGNGAPLTLSLSRADGGAVYTDLLSGKEYEGALLKKGLTVLPDGEDEWSLMMHLKKNR